MLLNIPGFLMTSGTEVRKLIEYFIRKYYQIKLKGFFDVFLLFAKLYGKFLVSVGESFKLFCKLYFKKSK